MKMRLFPVSMILLLNLAVCLPATAAVTPDRINVTSAPHNAIPNDGLDDTAAINSAINAGLNPTRSVYFPPGTYNYNGRITLTANRSYRVYGDGPGVSTIIFTGATAGIYVSHTAMHTLNVEGLTLKANAANCGTAIEARFNVGAPAAKNRTAAIHNVQIIGSTTDGTSGGYWTQGIKLFRGENSVIDKVQISGNKGVTQNGIFLEAPPSNPPNPTDPTHPATGFQLTNLQIKWCNTALRTSGWVEGLYLSGFEFFSCGRSSMPAVDLTSAPIPKPVFHLLNGHVDMIGEGVRVTTLGQIKITNVRFTHLSNPDPDNPQPGNMLSFFDCGDVLVSECTFYGVNSGTVSDENGIWLDDAHHVRIAGNTFTNMLPVAGSCIVALATNTLVRITDNIFNSVRNKCSDQNPDPNEPYFHGNHPAP